jgi:ABC-2 type transport system permease protein
MKKELADHVSSYRFLLLFALIAMVSLITVYFAGRHITQELEGVAKPRHVFLMLFTASGIRFSLTQFVAFFGPLIGLLLGFDTINRERNEGTLSKLLSQPIYRDAVINGKFLAAVADPAAVIQRIKLERALSLVSPMELYTSGTIAIIDPMRRTTRLFVPMGRLERLSLERFSGPLPLGQSVLVVAPYIITLVAMTLLCFAVSYTVFMRQEIRSI